MVTMQDIADRAQVSKGTVSYVINGKHEKVGIKKETCEHILAIAKEMGYRNNAIARTMRTGKSNTIAIVGWFSGDYSMTYFKGLSQMANRQGYSVKLLIVHWDETIGKKDLDFSIQSIIENKIDGVVLGSLPHTSFYDRFVKELNHEKIPFMINSHDESHKKYNHICSDDREGVRLGTQAMIDKGRRKIMFVCPNGAEPPYAQLRFQGYRLAMESAGLEAKVVRLEDVDDLQMAQKKLFSLNPDAVVCSGDGTAMKVLHHAHYSGLIVPNNLSVLGFGNMDQQLLKWTIPSLSTITPRYEGMGEKVAEILIGMIKNPSDSIVNINVPVDLDFREST